MPKGNKRSSTHEKAARRITLTGEVDFDRVNRVIIPEMEPDYSRPPRKPRPPKKPAPPPDSKWEVGINGMGIIGGKTGRRGVR